MPNEDLLYPSNSGEDMLSIRDLDCDPRGRVKC